jgi:hypothetical protein
MNGDVMIAAGPHKAGNTAAVLDPVTKTVTGAARFANSQEGYERLTGFAGRWEQRRAAVEGCRGAGRSLAQRLVADGEQVPGRARKAGRPGARVLPACTPRAMAARPAGTMPSPVGLAALDGAGITQVTSDDALVSPRLLRSPGGTRAAAHPGGVPAAPAGRRADPRRDARRAVCVQGRSGPGQVAARR